ncbi:MAG TPA: LuxR C-terminal-related transcriptional regulator [Candidatus Limnocylindrales bacterium]|nr:LuxR C-terminal-related transcriptional regulator [Candidatus Limnocylindrales bacterium]
MGERTDGATFGALLRRRRDAAGLTQDELAERAGLTAKAISALERGERRRPYPATIRAISDALGLTDAERSALIGSVPSRGTPIREPDQDARVERRDHLPPESTPLLGRDEERAVLRDQLLSPEVRLITVVGTGGVGKTRLATSVARSLVDHDAFPDGVWFVDLSSTTDPSLVPAAMARALGLTDPGAGRSLAALERFAAPRRMLIVLDNVEHVLAASPDIGRLIAAAPGLTVLATSREPLRLRWERTLPLLPLALPDPRHLPPIEELAAVPAVALFIERVRAANPGFALNDAESAAVAELCVRLDGLPLAIELVAARAAQLGPATTLARLARRLPVPGSAMRDAPARQRSLRATLNWSLDLLAPPERLVFERVAVFAGGCTVDGAEAVAGTGAPAADDAQGADDATGVLEALSSLADKNLIVVRAAGVGSAAPGEPRFRMLDTVRSVALDLLEGSGVADDVRVRQARYLTALAEELAPQLRGASQAPIAARLEAEEDNFRQVLDWARHSGRQDALEEGLRLVGALAWYWFLHGFPAEAGEWFEALLGPIDDDTPVEPGSDGERAMSVRAKALNAAGFRATDQGEYELAAEFHAQALAIWGRLRDTAGLVTSLHGVGDTALWQGEADRAQRTYEEGLGLAEAEGTAEDVALFAFHLGQLSWLVDRLDDADAYGQQALAVARQAESETWTRYSLFLLASIAHERGDIGRAGELYRDAIRRAWEHHDRLCVRMALPGLAALATLEGDPARALRLAGAASSLEENAGIWAFPPIRERHERWLAAAERALDADARTAAWAAGRALSIDDVIADALEPVTSTQPGARSASGRGVGLLSSREREVLDLLARGSTNREIAAALFVTEHTAKYHVASLFNKLGATNRAEAVTRAVALGLLIPRSD